MALSLVDRVLIQRTQEVMERFNRDDFVEERAIARPTPKSKCPAPGCQVRTHGGPCQKHWRLRRKPTSGMSDPSGKVRP